MSFILFQDRKLTNHRKCSVEGCVNDEYGMGLCRHHVAEAFWQQHHEKWLKHDEEQVRLKRTNKVYIEDDHAVMVIANKQGLEALVLIDIEDTRELKRHRWVYSQGYALTTIEGKVIRMHRHLLQIELGMLGDHINGNTLDNRKINLRSCNHQENSRNRGVSTRNKSGAPGVQWDKGRNKWLAHIGINGSTKHLGYFDNFEDAVQARKKAEQQYFGEFARV